MHPFAPADQAAGYAELIAQLEAWLAEVTGYDAVSVQPNAGSQGELAGLLAIRAYHRANGEIDRDVCLIPSSAHGTNAASAVMAGMRVVVVACDDDGNVDLADLDRKIEAHGDALAAIMVTYPSTHGVYETAIAELCAQVHDAGGQVYVDGANLNALLGFAKPGQFGADVSHLNLHKTFCIPHGGGGPGVGPVAVRAHLAPYLPGHPLDATADGAVGPISAAPYGSAGHPADPVGVPADDGPGRPGPGDRGGGAGRQLRRGPAARRTSRCSTPATRAWSPTSASWTCGRSPRPPASRVDDVAKRLIDYGFHAPTMSFPVAGTLMVEPTESEDLAELDRFCDAMIAIRDEIDRGRRGHLAGRRQPAGERAAHRGDGDRRRVGSRVPALGGGLPGRYARVEVLAAGAAHRRRVRRPRTWCAPARRRRRSSSDAGSASSVARPSALRGTRPPRAECACSQLSRWRTGCRVEALHLGGRCDARSPKSTRRASGGLRCGVGRVVRRGAAVCVHGAAIRQDLTVVFKDDDAVAQEAPSLLGEAGDDACGVVVVGISRGAGRLVRAHRNSPGWVYMSTNGVSTGQTRCLLPGGPVAAPGERPNRSCVVTHMTKHARYLAEPRSFEQVTLKSAQIRPFG